MRVCRFEQLLSQINAHGQDRPRPGSSRRRSSIRATCLCALAPPPGAGCAPVLTTNHAQLMGPTVALLSSRTGRVHKPDHPWLARMRAALVTAERSRQTLLAVHGTATYRWVRAAQELLACPVHFVRAYPLPAAFESAPEPFLQRFLRQLTASDLHTAVLLPRNPDLFEPVADYVAAALAKRVVVVYARPRGNIDRLLRLPWLAGRAHWIDPPHEHIPPTPTSAPQPPQETGPEPAPVASLVWDDFLFHWTRAQNEGWPQETPHAALVKLLLGTDSYDAFSALKRIAGRGVVHATGSAHPRVSLTATAPTEWIECRVFRHHRGRFDYEPYGVAIHKGEAIAQGAFPVSYCLPAIYDRLPVRMRAPFQPVHSPINPRLRWTREDEWRLFGDLVLSAAPVGAVVFLTATPEEARAISRISGRQCAYFRAR